MRVHPTNPDIVWAAASGTPFGPSDERGIFKTRDGGKTWKKTLFVDNEHGGRDIEVDWQNPDVALRRDLSGLPQGLGHHQRRSGRQGRHLQVGRRRRDMEEDQRRPAIEADRQDRSRHRAQQPQGALRDDRGARQRRRPLPLERRRRELDAVNSSQRLRARPFYFNYVSVNPKNENEVWVSELGFHKSSDGGKTFTAVETPHSDNHGVWINPDNPDIMLNINDGGANVTLNGGKSWSSILNQPHAEYYMVAVDEQYPYRLYVPQQDNTTLIVPSLSPYSWGLDHPAEMWQQASGCETGQIWPRKDGSVIWGACKGEVGRYNVLTGQEKHYWVYPQNRYGHDPDEIKYRFPRQTVVYVSPHDDKIVYQASHVLHRSTDDGVTWETISPDLTAHEAEYQIVPGSPITRDVTGEEVYSSIYSMIESRLEKGVIWVGANDGPVHVSRDNGKTWKNVTPKGLGPGGRVQTIEDSPHRKGTAYVAIYRFLREHDLKPYIYKTENYGESWTLLTDGKNGIPADHPTRVVREDPAREGLLYAGTEFSAFVSFNAGRNWQSLTQNLPATPVADIKVHRNDLVIATMGRSLWIMDNVTPLQQLAATAGLKPGRHGHQRLGRSRPIKPAAAALCRPSICSSRARPSAIATRRARAATAIPNTRRQACRSTCGSKPRRPPTPSWSSSMRRGRSFAASACHARRKPATGPEMRGPVRGQGGASGLKPEAGMQRFTWDMRHAGPWAPNAPNGGGGGPMVAPGKYTARLTAGPGAVAHVRSQGRSARHA